MIYNRYSQIYLKTVKCVKKLKNYVEREKGVIKQGYVLLSFIAQPIRTFLHHKKPGCQVHFHIKRPNFNLIFCHKNRFMQYISTLKSQKNTV
jgi:hypothetical protein